MFEKIIILDFGSQTTQLIGRRLRELGEYCEIVPYNKFPEKTDHIKGVILSGSPYSVHDPQAFQIDLTAFRGKYPVLAIGYGAQYITHVSGGKVQADNTREYKESNFSFIDQTDRLLKNISENSQIWLSHSDLIEKLPENFSCIASTSNIEHVAFRIDDENIWGIQFHPEACCTQDGLILLENFLDICGCSRNWSPALFIESTIAELKQQLGNDKVVLGLSGGVDSSVAAVLLHKAIGKNLSCIFVDHGLLRKNEFRNVLNDYKHLGLNVIGVEAQERFYKALAGVTDPEEKRKIIGHGFVEVFDEEAQKIKDVKWLAQGTIYPDIIESQSTTGMVIKSHHNVGGLPDKMKLKLCEPLRLLFKDEVRRVGVELGMMSHLIKRHPFPGPGLGVRILGEITPEKVHILQEADDIFIKGLRDWNLYDRVWQAGAILLPVQSVGITDGKRTYENAVALRAVTSIDAMTADWSHLPHEFLMKISTDIINNVKGINRVVYDISSKPPATIEWE